MSLALYRKYRSRSFSDVVGQDHITKTLKTSVDNNTFSHAYLMTGLRGVGKTSIARIFAAYINDIKYEDLLSNPDIIEIDAASNRKIDEIRDLREKVNIAPSSLKYKVYIIDEVHMLTREAFNALLKTLEEPPKHCVLILATTDYHKLPETIISRCIRFSFRAISPEDIAKRLDHIASQEKIKIDEKALETIAENSSGSLRDAISILDQARNIKDKITSEDIEQLLGIASISRITHLTEATLSGDSKEIINLIELMRTSGSNAGQVIDQLTRYIRKKIVSGQQSMVLLDLLSEIIKINDYSDKWLAFEVCLLKSSLGRKRETVSTDPQIINTVKKTPQTPSPIQEIKKSENMWQNVLNELKKSNSTLYGVARMAEAAPNGDVLELKLKFNFHKKQLDIKSNQAKIIEIAKKHNAKITSINTTIISHEPVAGTQPAYDGAKDITNISNVFGSVEMLE